MQIAFDYRDTPERSPQETEWNLHEQLTNCYRTALGHELPNSFVVLQGLAQALLREQADQLDAAGIRYLERFLQIAQRSDRLVRKLADLGKMTENAIAPGDVDFADVVQEAVAQMKIQFSDRPFQIRTNTEVVRGAVPYKAMHEIVVELLRNAIQSNTRDTHVDIEVGCRFRENHAQCWIRDNGRGLPADPKRWFTPFTGTRDGHVGIGLFCVRQLIARWRGMIQVESEPGEGTEVTVTLPIATELESASVPPPRAVPQREG